MQVKDIITLHYPTLSYSDTGERALRLMNEYRVFHLPLLQKDVYVALITEDDLLDWDTPEEPLSFAEFLNFRPAIANDAHPLEALKLFKNFSLSVLPVLDKQLHYAGLLTMESLIQYLANNNAVQEPGAILEIEVGFRNYSMSEIARICESNDVIILSSTIRFVPERNLYLLTLKVNKSEVQSLVATFERYDYYVSSVYAATLQSDDLHSNLDQLMMYINL